MKIENKKIMDVVKLYSKELSDKLKARTNELAEAYRLLDESDRRYKYAIKAVKQGILDWSIMNDELVLNDVFLENLGYERSDIIMRNLEDFKNYIHPDQRESFFEAIRQHMKSGNRMEMRVQLMGKFGNYVWLNFIGLVVEWDKKNRPIRFIGACIDISNQMNLEKELLQANNELKLINETKRNFIANVSHELRTPMNSILGFASLYEESSEAEVQARYVDHIKTSADTLYKVVDDMLAFSAISNSMVASEMNNFKLDEFLHEIGSGIYESVINKNLDFSMKIDWEFPFYLIGYEALLKKTIMVVLDNAVKFTEKGLIELGVNKVKQEGEIITLEFLVKDTGVGIEEDEQEYLFKAFNQKDGSSTRSYEGLGLGLAIAFDHIKSMDGTIKIESEKNQGTRVSMQIPFRVASEVKRIKMKLLDNEKFPVVLYDRYVNIADELEQMLIDLGFPVYRVGDLLELKTRLVEHLGVHFVIACQKALGDIHPYVSLERHIIIGINNFSSDYIEGWIHGTVKKPIIASELYNVLMESLVKHHPKIVETEMEVKVPVKAIESMEDMRILVVEDSVMNREIMENILSPLHVTVAFAEDGPSALAIKDAKNYDLIFMDINLPGINGDEVCRQLRQRTELDRIPIIGLTAEVGMDRVRAYKDAGMNDVLIKPYNVEQIYRTIERYASGLLPEIEEAMQVNEWVDPILSPLDKAGIDKEGALKRLNGNVTLYMSLLENFCKAYRNWSAKILYDEGKITDLKVAYHTLQGLAGNLGATSIQQLTHELDMKTDRDLIAISETDIKALDMSLKVFLDAIQVVLENIKGDGGSDQPFDYAYTDVEVSQIVSALIEEIEDYDTAAIDRLKMLDYRKFLQPIADQLKKVDQAVQGFEFDRALTYMRELQESMKR